jgi:hypothetical protein
MTNLNSENLHIWSYYIVLLFHISLWMLYSFKIVYISYSFAEAAKLYWKISSN